jgi:hypothetical protein
MTAQEITRTGHVAADRRVRQGRCVELPCGYATTPSGIAGNASAG